MTKNLWPDELKILVIDDEQDTLNLIRLCLEQAGFRVLRTNRPQEGLNLALREEPDLLLLDLMMPGIDGLEILRRLRRHPSLSKLPVIIISARAGSVSQQRMLQLEPHMDTVDACIGKPFNPAGLLKTVKEVLLKHREYLLEKQVNQKPRRTWQREQVLGL